MQILELFQDRDLIIARKLKRTSIRKRISNRNLEQHGQKILRTKSYPLHEN